MAKLKSLELKTNFEQYSIFLTTINKNRFNSMINECIYDRFVYCPLKYLKHTHIGILL